MYFRLQLVRAVRRLGNPYQPISGSGQSPLPINLGQPARQQFTNRFACSLHDLRRIRLFQRYKSVFSCAQSSPAAIRARLGELNQLSYPNR